MILSDEDTLRMGDGMEPESWLWLKSTTWSEDMLKIIEGIKAWKLILIQIHYLQVRKIANGFWDGTLQHIVR